MSDTKTFQLALLVSILFHSVFFLSLPHMSFLPSKRSLEYLKITYYKIKETQEIKKTLPKKAEPIVRDLPEIKKQEILNPPLGSPKATAKNDKKIDKDVGRITAVEKKGEKKFEVVIEEEKDDAKKATYISYYKAVREKIKQYADRNYPKNRNLGEGEIFLSFVVASSGELLQVRVIDEKSANNNLLRNISINSIRDASPFPAFPKGMSQYQIAFNIIISFELDR